MNMKCTQLLTGFGYQALRITEKLGDDYSYHNIIRELYEEYEPEKGKGSVFNQMMSLREDQMRLLESLPIR